jgi:hypothetical protein
MHIQTRCGVEIHIDPCFHRCTVNPISPYFHSDRIVSRTRWTTPICVRVKEVLVFRMMKCLSPFYRKEKIVVGLVDVNNPEAMNSRFAWIFFQHHVHHFEPSLEGISESNRVIEECNMRSYQFFTMSLKLLFRFVFFFCERRRFPESMVVS